MKAEERAAANLERADANGTEPVGDRPVATGDAPGAVTHERCAHHPGRAAVARCSACEEPICLACAVPVRGRVIGPECLAAELGDPALTAPPDPEPAIAGSWGAWVPNVRWSMVAAVAAVVLLPTAWWFRARGTGATIVILGGLAVVSGSALAIAFPPTFQAASWGPWLAAVGGAVSVAGAVASGIMERRPRQGV